MSHWSGAGAEDVAPSTFCPPAGSHLAAILLDPHCRQVHAEGQIVACPNAATLESAVLSSSHLPLAIPHGCHMDAFLCQLVWSNPNCYCGTALAWWEGERRLDLVFPCCYQENREELERENANSTAFRVTCSSSLPGEREKWKHTVALSIA